MARFVIEGEWSGYRSEQRRVVHRTVHKASRRELRAWAEKTRAILFDDGTTLDLAVRDCKPRERVRQIDGYSSLIDECARRNVSSVREIIKDRREQETSG